MQLICRYHPNESSLNRRITKTDEADIAAADVTIKLILENSVAMSEHLNHQKELDCQLHKIASAEEKITSIKRL